MTVGRANLFEKICKIFRRILALSDEGQISATVESQAQSGCKRVTRFEFAVDLAYASETEPEEI